MPSALDISLAVPEAIDPSSPLLDEGFRRPFGHALLDGQGSKNIPKLRACNEGAQQRTRDPNLFAEVMEAARLYAVTYPLHSTEFGSRFVYGDWNTWSDLVLRAQAVKAGVHETAEALLAPCRAQLIMEAFGSSWALHSGHRWPGRDCILAGARSFVVDKEADPNPGSYFDEHGRYKAPFKSLTHGDNQQGNILSAAIGEAPPSGQFGEADRACRRHLAPGGLHGWVTGSERTFLRHLADLGKAGSLSAGDLEALAWAVNCFNDGSARTPQAPVVFIVTDECRACVVERWIGSGSTSMMYGFVWYAWGRPAIPHLDAIGWWPQDANCAWLTAGEPRRNGDAHGVAYWNPDAAEIRAQRDTGDWFDVASMRYRPGWAALPVPGEVLAAVRIGPSGAEIIAGQGQTGTVRQLLERSIGELTHAIRNHPPTLEWLIAAHRPLVEAWPRTTGRPQRLIGRAMHRLGVDIGLIPPAPSKGRLRKTRRIVRRAKRKLT